MSRTDRTLLDVDVTEKELQANVLELAGHFGWLAYHTHDSRRSNPGFPDLVLVRGTRLIFAELKREGGRVTGPQDEWLGALSFVQNVSVYVWRPSDWRSGEIERILR